MGKRLVPLEEAPQKKRLVPLGPDLDNIDPEEVIDWKQSMRLSGVEKPEDKLRIVRSYFPDAVPYGDGNFAFTDPKTGKTHLWNQEGWIPSTNDLAASVPGAAELTGSILGGVGGGAIGAAAGAPSGPGAAATTIGGAMTGAGLGGASFREGAQDLIQWWNGDEDTRTNEEALKDFAGNAALDATGEGVGRVVAAAAKPALRTAQRAILGKPVAQAAASQALKEAEELGLKPTYGTLTQSERVLQREAELAKASPNGRVARSVRELDDALGARVQDTARQIAPISGSKAEVGGLLRDAAKKAETGEITRLENMYGEVDALAKGTNASGSNLQQVLRDLNAEKAAMGKAEKLTKGPTIDNAIKYTKKINEDVKAGLPFKKARDFRTDINPLAYGKKENPASKAYFQRIYKAATDDIMESARGVSDDAAAKLSEADAGWSLYKTNGTKKVLEGTLKRGNEPTKVYDFYSRMVRQAPESLKTVKTTLTKEGGEDAWNSFVAHHVSELGMQTTKTGRNFNPSVFVKQMTNMPKESAETLLGGKYAGLGEDLKKLSGLAARRAAAKGVRVEDESLTKQLLKYVLPLGGGFTVGGAPLAVGAAATKYAGKKAWNAYQQRLLTDPGVVRELVNLPKMEFKKTGWDAIKARLMASATSESGKEAVRQLLEEYENSKK